MRRSIKYTRQVEYLKEREGKELILNGVVIPFTYIIIFNPLNNPAELMLSEFCR